MPVDPDLILGGDTYLSYALDYVVTEAAGIRFGENPTYSVADFLETYPQFGAEAGGTPPIPTTVLTAYVNLASACLAYERWKECWEVGMGFFVAHYATLYLQALANVGDTAKTIASAGVAKGIQASKSVNDVSVSYQSVVTGWERWGSWNLTLFGQQFVQMANIIGMGAIVVW